MRARQPGFTTNIENQIVGLDRSLILLRSKIGHVDVVGLEECGQHVVASFIRCGEWRGPPGNLVKAELHWPWRYESLVDKDINRIRVVGCYELDLVGVGRLPQFFSQLKEIFSVTRLECVAGDANVFLRRARWCELAVPAHQAERHSQRTAPHCVRYESIP